MGNEDINYTVESTVNKDINRLKHIIVYCYKIEEAIKKLPKLKTEEAYKKESNYNIRDLTCFYLLQIGELTIGLTDEFKASYNDLPWKAIKGFRNIVAHRYNTVDIETVWNIIKEHIPKLKEECLNIILGQQPEYTNELKEELSLAGIKISTGFKR